MIIPKNTPIKIDGDTVIMSIQYPHNNATHYGPYRLMSFPKSVKTLHLKRPENKHLLCNAGKYRTTDYTLPNTYYEIPTEALYIQDLKIEICKNCLKCARV